ncbi:MAG: hypothetical protein ACW99G_03080 [Candidatus Thorarchaeota archaeon]|jgi:indoleamine 2,3-dioxygenase
MSIWNVDSRGFLPSKEAVINYETSNDGNVVFTIAQLANILPELAKMRSVREEMVSRLRNLDQSKIHSWIDYHINNRSTPQGMNSQISLERLWRDFSYMASMYIWAPNEIPQKRLPREIAVPFNYLANKLDRKPILSYMAYCLTNWTLKKAPRKMLKESKEDFEKRYVDEIKLGNIQLLQNFTSSGDARRDEDWFILVHVDIEARAAQGIKAIIDSVNILNKKNPESVRKCLEDLCESIKQMNATMDRMPEECSPEVYFDKVRPYIYSFEDVVYEGVDPNPVTYRGETGAQSSIVPAMQIALGVLHKDSILTKHLKDMRSYMPKEHREFLEDLENRPEHLTFRHFVEDHLTLRPYYNECVKELFKFRETHLKYAVDYIQKKCDDPKGTGGTPYVPWLTQLTKETESFYL